MSRFTSRYMGRANWERLARLTALCPALGAEKVSMSSRTLLRALYSAQPSTSKSPNSAWRTCWALTLFYPRIRRNSITQPFTRSLHYVAKNFNRNDFTTGSVCRPRMCQGNFYHSECLYFTQNPNVAASRHCESSSTKESRWLRSRNLRTASNGTFC